MAGLCFPDYKMLLVAVFLILISPSLSKNEDHKPCRCYPGDRCWPSAHQFAALNHSLGGQLIATVPLASPCHDDEFSPFNATECKILQAVWLEPQTHYVDPASIMAPFFANRSCDPFLPRSDRCIVGAYNAFTVNVSEDSHIAKTIHFATENNIRLTIRNTGHDYNGRSTGAGSIGLWTRHMKDIQISDYRSPHYTGKAMKMGAGVQGFEAYSAANDRGLAVVGGECPTVGVAGGYAQGGGHSALASKYGLAADQVLEWEVIDGEGKYHLASRTQNTDLFWALGGGGGGTYGVVTSMTAKAHPDIPVSGANLTFTNDGISQDTFYEAVAAYHAILPTIVDAGVMSICIFTNTTFVLGPLTGPGLPAVELEQLLMPFLNKLKQLHIKYLWVVRQFPGYLAQFTAMQFPIQVGTSQYGGRLIPRSVVADENEKLTSAYRFINENGGVVCGVAVNVSTKVAGNVYNAIHPVWRETLIDTVILTPWNFTAPLEEMIANQRKMTNELVPRLKALTPNGGCYLNEGDFLEPDWKGSFYGVNYQRLLSIKNRYDPNHVFYANRAVGSDYWVEEMDGRLCKA